MIGLFDALILCLVEGLTEFIPVSSTGHLIIVGALLGLEGEAIKTFEVFIQLGAILSVVALYPKRFAGLFDLRNPSGGLTGKSGLIKFAVACLPVFLLGFIFRKTIKTYLFGPMTVAWALIVGGLLLIWVEKRSVIQTNDRLESITLRESFIIGIFQCLALWPGMSRSGATIIGGMLLGLSRTVAAEFSFLVAVPVMCVAVGYDLLKSIDYLQVSDAPLFVFGFIASFIISLVAIKFFIRLLSAFTLRGFGWYRIGLGMVILCVFGLRT